MKLGLKQALRVALVLVFVTGMAKPAAADWLLTPYFGIVFSGAANTLDVATFDEVFEQRANFGLSASGMAKGIFGWEADISYTPNFVQLTEGGGDFEFFNVDSSLTTVMGNLVLAVPIGGTTGGGVRPYFTAGAGLMRANINFGDLFDDLSTNDLAINVGGGLHVFFSDNIGLRGDVRYFRDLGQTEDDVRLEGDDFFDEDFALEDFDFWRATIGITFRFGG
jgi:opacity protein-like surface antigen